MKASQKSVYVGVALAVSAAFIWSWNFVVARDIASSVPPVSIAFYRWLAATLFFVPFGWRSFRKALPLVKKHGWYLLWVAVTGVSLFNTLLYIAAHYSSAINLAMVGTTSSPVFALLLAAVFLREPVTPLRVAGMLICMCGIALLLSNGSLTRLFAFRFSRGDWVILGAALAFAIYNSLVKRKPAALSAEAFLFAIFSLGTLLLVPFFIWEQSTAAPIVWNLKLGGILLYLGLGASVMAFLSWNSAIARLGAARTALFGNLIPLFAIVEAIILLGERFTRIHAASASLIIVGLIMANVNRMSFPREEKRLQKT